MVVEVETKCAGMYNVMYDALLLLMNVLGAEGGPVASKIDYIPQLGTLSRRELNQK
jgi:hypothetical protein